MSIKKTSVVLVLTLVLSSGLFLTSPRTAHAQVGAITCSASSLFGSASGVATSLSSKVPVADSVVQGNTTAVKNIDCTWKGIAWQLAHTVLHSLTGSVVNWINSGFQGSPAFLTNPEGYFLDLGDQLTGQFISDTGVLSALCSPFSVDVRLALALGQTNGQYRYSCTLGSIINNVQNSTINGMSIGGFMNGDFSQGGWPAFIAIGEPNNNEASLYLQAHSDLLERIGAKKDEVNKELSQGNGFLSYQACNTISADQVQAAADAQGVDQLGLESAAYTGNGNTGISSGSAVPWYSLNSGNITVGIDSHGNATYQSCQNVTPGSVISSSLTKVLGASADELNMTNDINQVVSALFSQLLQKTLSGGLFNASQSSSGSNLGSIANQLINDQQAQQNSAALQGQVAGEVQTNADTAQQAVTYRSQIVTAILGEQSLYQTTQTCIANELAVALATTTTQTTATQNSYTYGTYNNNIQNLNQGNWNYTQQQRPLTSGYLQNELTSITAAIAGISQQISDAETNLATASSSVNLYQTAANQISGASSLSQATDLSNQLSTQLSTIPYNAAADPSVAQSDLNSTLSGITALETSRQPYQTVCNGQMPISQ